jgi:hypothetical protein
VRAARREYSGRMKRRALLLVALLVFAAVPSRGQTPAGDGTDRWLKLQWALEGQAIRGRVYNEFFRPADKVRLRIDGLDAADQVVETRYEWVLGVVPALGNRYFEVRVPPGADHFRVAVASYTFILGPDRFP